MSPKAVPPGIHAALWMSGALVSFSAMAIAGRQLSVELTTFQILFFRSLGGLAVLAALLQRSGWAQVRTHVFGTHLLRNVVHFGGQYAWFYGIALIPLTEVFAIEFTVPIWTAILATVFLGERMSGLRALAVALGFVGILVILRSGVEAISAPAREIVKTGEEITIAGVKMVFQLTPGTEALAEMNTYFPQLKALWMAENTTHTMSRADFDDIMLQTATLESKIEADAVKVQGDPKKFGELIALLDSFDFRFNIVTLQVRAPPPPAQADA